MGIIMIKISKDAQKVFRFYIPMQIL